MKAFFLIGLGLLYLLAGHQFFQCGIPYFLVKEFEATYQAPLSKRSLGGVGLYFTVDACYI